ncbi:MAG: T9SS type A sorting domain-containing protein, partial [Bacteroidota bacterium]
PGAPISVVNCVADAGTITADFSQVSLVGGSASLSATPDGNINVPAGYSVIYVLTSGSGLVIEQVNTTPDFTVSATGDYTIHTLVFNGDSNSSDFLDLSVVQFGTTTGVDVLNLVTANGICASLDVPGAPISVVNCVADAGTITALNSNSSLLNGQAILTGVPDGNINVPTGYSVIYVLTSGTGLVIEQVNTMPTFAVTDTGLFTIHTLVYNADSNSSDFLDLSIVQFGTTTGVDVLNLVTANGICASLDVPGAPITVFECTADAGTITPDFSSVSLMNGSATLTATPDGNINVPAGYNVLYVLTSDSNLVIQQVDTLPSFTVTAPGLYTIHTLVYNPDTSSLNFLDLSVVVPGVTTGVDVLNLIAANGICADLDAAGAPIDVVGMLRFTFFNVRGDLSSIQPSAKLIWGIEGSEQGGKLGIEKSQDAVVFQNIGNIRVNRTEANEVIFDYNDSNIFGGDTYYRIKYNSVTGGVLYSDLFKFNDAGGLQPVLEAFPNPVVNSLKFTVQNMGTVNYTVTDLSGKVFLQGQVDFDTENEMQLDLSNLSPGVYNLLVRDIESGRSQVAKLIKQ